MKRKHYFNSDRLKSHWKLCGQKQIPDTCLKFIYFGKSQNTLDFRVTYLGVLYSETLCSLSFGMTLFLLTPGPQPWCE